MSKTSCSVTIDTELLAWLDEKVRDRIFSSRSHGLDFILNEHIKNIKTANREGADVKDKK